MHWVASTNRYVDIFRFIREFKDTWLIANRLHNEVD